MSETRPVVVITGASGLIGSAVAADLAGDYEIAALDVREPGGPPHPGVHFFRCDLTDAENLERALSEVRARLGKQVASVIHLAAYYDFSGEPSPLYEALTVEGTRRLIGGLGERFEVEQLVFSSSILVMKSAGEGERIDESSPVEAEWSYPVSKLAAEAIVSAADTPFPTVILRVGGVYDEGGHSPPLTQQIWRIRERVFESHFFPGNPGHGQSFIHLDDVASSIRRVVTRRRDLGRRELFMIGGPDIMSYAQLQASIGELLHGEEWLTVRIPRPLAKAGAWLKEKTALDENAPFIRPWMIDLADANYPLDIERARRLLGWTPAHRLETTLPRIIRRLREDPERWYRENRLPLPPS